MKNKHTKGCLFVVSGPSGVGKGTILKEVFKQNNNAVFSVSATTRTPRDGEVDGEHYFFVSDEHFKEMIENDEFLEYANVFGLAKYGTPKKFIDDCIAHGKDVFLDIDVQGAAMVKKAMPEAVSIFILPPSVEELEKRLRSRGTETNKAIEKRLATAKEELQLAKTYDYTIINDIVKNAADKMLGIIYKENKKANE